LTLYKTKAKQKAHQSTKKKHPSHQTPEPPFHPPTHHHPHPNKNANKKNPFPKPDGGDTVRSESCCRIISFPTHVVSLNDISAEAHAFTFVMKSEMGSLGQSPGLFSWIFLSNILVGL